MGLKSAQEAPPGCYVLKVIWSFLSDLDSSIRYQSIKDVYRLGKFSSDKKKPRLLLVKFIKAADVSTVLSKRGSLRNSLVSIKPVTCPPWNENVSHCC